MKLTKLLALLLALTLVFTLAACGNSNNNDPSGSQQGTNAPLNREDDTSSTENQGGENSTINPEDIDFASIMAGNGATDVVWGKQDEATKQAIIADAKKDGVDVSFGTDGSMTVVDTDGTTMVQKPDGTWTIKDAEGNDGQVGGDWPDNEFTKLVPKPEFEFLAANTDANSFSVVFTSATIEQIKDYATKLKAAGFNINEEVEDQEMMGMVIYSFTAENADGYTVSLTFASDNSGLEISK